MPDFETKPWSTIADFVVTDLLLASPAFGDPEQKAHVNLQPFSFFLASKHLLFLTRTRLSPCTCLQNSWFVFKIPVLALVRILLILLV